MKSENLRRRVFTRNIFFIIAAFYMLFRKIDRNLDSRIFNLPNQLLNKTVSASVFLSKTLSLPASVRFANVPVNETVDFLANLANRAKLDERFDKRKRDLASQCAQLSASNLTSNADTWSHVIGDMSVPRQDGKDAQAVFGCIPPQSGSTIFNAWWFDIYHPNDEFNKKARAKLKLWKDNVQISEWNELLTRADVVKFAVVRHPLTRFVSVWDDHFCRSCEHPKDPFLEKKIVLDDEAEYQISLPELAQAVVDQETSTDMFESQLNTCRLCEIDYDYILKLETIDQDFPYLMAKLGRLDNSKELVSPETVHRIKNANLYGYFFATLAPSQLTDLVQHYFSDLKLLGYTFNQAKNLIGGWD